MTDSRRPCGRGNVGCRFARCAAAEREGHNEAVPLTGSPDYHKVGLAAKLTSIRLRRHLSDHAWRVGGPHRKLSESGEDGEQPSLFGHHYLLAFRPSSRSGEAVSPGERVSEMVSVKPSPLVLDQVSKKGSFGRTDFSGLVGFFRAPGTVPNAANAGMLAPGTVPNAALS